MSRTATKALWGAVGAAVMLLVGIGTITAAYMVGLPGGGCSAGSVAGPR